MSTEHGPILRRGTVTNDITPIGTFASSTGLPTESTTTSFINNSVGTASGHDSVSGSPVLKQSLISIVGSSPFVSYNSFGSQFTDNVEQLSGVTPNSVITQSTAGIELPIPQPPTTKYYQMTGYYVTGAVFESFVVTGSPTASSVTNPNTGHMLINTFVSSFWQR
jgi:hypothetical protein